MKTTKLFLISIVIFSVLGLSMQAQAGLETIGTATYGGSDYNLIYDNDDHLVWLDYTNGIANWAAQDSWALGLNGTGVLTYNLNAGVSVDWGMDLWRLPATAQPDSSCGLQLYLGGPNPLPPQGYGYNCTGSEMGHLYYTELGNSAGGPLSNTGDFENLQAVIYWSTEYAPNTFFAWVFNTNEGDQDVHDKGNFYYPAIPVRSGLAVVPEPISSTLFIIGGATLGVRRFRKKFRT